MGKGYGSGSTPAAAANREILSVLTFGTSEISTGGGQYGDEVVADKLFPSFINDWALSDRQDARKAQDAAAKQEKATIQEQKPSLLAPDLGDAIRMRALTGGTGQGRASTFLGGQRTALGG